MRGSMPVAGSGLVDSRGLPELPAGPNAGFRLLARVFASPTGLWTLKGGAVLGLRWTASDMSWRAATR